MERFINVRPTPTMSNGLPGLLQLSSETSRIFIQSKLLMTTNSIKLLYDFYL
jgi:hypothetical protein